MLDNAVKAAVYTKLTSALGVGTAVYDTTAPSAATPPYVVYFKQAGAPTYTFASRAWESKLLSVKAVTAGGSRASAGTIADLIDATLNDQPLTVAGGSVMVVRRETDIDYDERADGQTVYHHVGATYRIGVQ